MTSTGRNSTHYDVLGIGPEATAEEIKRAYRRKVLELHPDAARHPEGAPDPEAFKRVRLAWEVLGDESERLRYDAAIGIGVARQAASHRGFGRLFDSLFSGLRTAVRSTTDLSADLAGDCATEDGERRRAG
jgi:curved DNA-binding protein CbpA